MSELKKKIFPKITKKIKSFLTDESGKITKKDALWLAAWAMLIGSADIADAATTHYSHVSWSTTYSEFTISYDTWACNVNHASWIVNGHYSGTPSATLNGAWVTGISWHASHASSWSWSGSWSGSW